MQIDHIEAKEIPDTRSRPTVETTLTAGGISVKASVPSGKSTGTEEARELRDADDGVTQAIANINGEIANTLVGRDFDSLDALDESLIKLDGTTNKSRLGANAILSVSIAATRMFSSLQGIPLWKFIEKQSGQKSCAPRLFVNVMNGGVHADFKLPFQEYLLVIDGKTSLILPQAKELFAKLGEILGSDSPMGDEGGYAPKFETLEKPFEILASLINGHSNVSIAIDAAASELLHDGNYQFLDKSYSSDELLKTYENLVDYFPIHSIEDPFSENAGSDFTRITERLGKKILIISDDLTTTNPSHINDAAKNGEMNAVLIKPNQIGTVKETIEAVRETYAAGFQAIASHRSGETNDTFIADFAYGIGAHGLKAGGLGQLERVEKYERLLAIERESEAV